MKNVTVSLTEPLLKQAREYARKQNTSVNALVRDLLIQTVTRSDFPEDFLKLAATVKGDSRGKKWTRESLYAR